MLATFDGFAMWYKVLFLDGPIHSRLRPQTTCQSEDIRCKEQLTEPGVFWPKQRGTLYHMAKQLLLECLNGKTQRKAFYFLGSDMARCSGDMARCSGVCVMRQAWFLQSEGSCAVSRSLHAVPLYHTIVWNGSTES